MAAKRGVPPHDPGDRPHKTVAVAVSAAASPLATLHRDLLALVFRHLKQRLLLRVAPLVCKYWRSVALCCVQSVALRLRPLTRTDRDPPLPPPLPLPVARFTSLTRLDTTCKVFTLSEGDLPNLQELVLSCDAPDSVCAACVALSRLSSLTSLVVNKSALHALAGGFPLLERLELSVSLSLSPLPVEHFTQRSLPSLRSLSLFTFQLMEALAPFLRLDLLSRLHTLSVRCSHDESALRRLVPALHLPHLTALTYHTLVDDAELSFILERCPALRDLAIDTTTQTLTSRLLPRLAPLLVGLRIDEPANVIVETAIGMCTRLVRLEPLPNSPWSEVDHPALYSAHASRLRCINVSIEEPDASRALQPLHLVPFLSPFTSLTYLRINSDELPGNTFHNIALPHLERIWWDVCEVPRTVPSHYIAYLLRRFLSWSPRRLRRIDVDSLEMHYAHADEGEWCFLFSEADAHPAFHVMRLLLSEQAVAQLRPVAARWRERLVLLLDQSIPTWRHVGARDLAVS